MAIYAIFNVATQNRNLADVRMREFYVEKVYTIHITKIVGWLRLNKNNRSFFLPLKKKKMSVTTLLH